MQDEFTKHIEFQTHVSLRSRLTYFLMERVGQMIEMTLEARQLLLTVSQEWKDVYAAFFSSVKLSLGKGKWTDDQLKEHPSLTVRMECENPDIIRYYMVKDLNDDYLWHVYFLGLDDYGVQALQGQQLPISQQQNGQKYVLHVADNPNLKAKGIILYLDSTMREVRFGYLLKPRSGNQPNRMTDTVFINSMVLRGVRWAYPIIESTRLEVGINIPGDGTWQFPRSLLPGASSWNQSKRANPVHVYGKHAVASTGRMS
jgi:hypothetical protein